MALEETVTIVNTSGKIISTGKHLLSFFKEARGAYHDKKAELARSQTYSQPQSPYRRHEGQYRSYETRAIHGRQSRHAGSRSNNSVASNGKYEVDNYHYSLRRRSHDTASHGSRGSSHGHDRPALTECNLRALSEVSTTDSRSSSPQPSPKVAYHSPYAETAPLDMALSKLDVHKQPTPDASQSTLVPRRHSDSDVTMPAPPKDKIDMHLAYGNMPPDLGDRVDLEPSPHAGEEHANQLVKHVEGLLDEAQCLHHSATAMIQHLQEKPDAAAEVALTLADLSSALAKLSPAFLAIVKGASPAVFGLLASPQFLIATGIAVGVTIVMFGGWKIVKRVVDAAHQTRTALPPAAPQPAPETTPDQQQEQFNPAQDPQSDRSGDGVDEALLVDEELSSIEAWRRGILPMGVEDESADVELITPQASRAARKSHASNKYKSDGLEAGVHSLRSRSPGKRSKKDCKMECDVCSERRSSGKRTHGSEREHGPHHHARTREHEASKSRDGRKHSEDRDRGSRANTERQISRLRNANDTENTRDGEKQHGRHRGSRSVVYESKPNRAYASSKGARSLGDAAPASPYKERYKDNMLKSIFTTKREKLVV